jgi:sulfatase maturation enzyme AslB (radical SAM superfamily)
MTWKCAAIDHGVTIFSNGKIGPCCKIQAEYLKPISELSNTQRFADLKTEFAPAACEKCISDEDQNVPSYRAMFNSLVTRDPGLQFVDIRNTNLCNLKCRYCGPHFSSRWAQELGHSITIRTTDINKDLLITDSLQLMYFTGGEPMINGDHWNLLEELIASNKANGITLMYNTNLTVLKYKDKDITDIWSHFKKVNVQCSIDAVGKTFEYIRSGADWPTVDANINALKKMPIGISLTPVISLLNIWNIGELCEYAAQKNIKINPIVLTGPDYLALDTIPDQLKQQALIAAKPLKKYIDINIYNNIIGLINNNQNQCLFKHAISHILLLDHLRDEKLFDLLPFKDVAQAEILENHEYESK